MHQTKWREGTLSIWPKTWCAATASLWSTWNRPNQCSRYLSYQISFNVHKKIVCCNISEEITYCIIWRRQITEASKIGHHFTKENVFQSKHPSLDLNFSMLRISQTPVGIWWRSKIRKRIVMSSLWKKNTFYKILQNSH